MLISPIAAKFAENTRYCMVDGVSVPACFSGLEDEYRCIRERAALSDQSHYGKFEISGSQAVDFLSFVNLPDIARLAIGKTSSSFMLEEDGSVFSECYVVSSGDSFLLLTEGRDKTEVAEYLKKHSENFDVKLKDVSELFAMLQLDGPYAWEVLKDLIGVKVLGLRYLETLDNQRIGSSAVQIIRSGKTGEFGYSLLVARDQAIECWDTLMKTGERYQILPVGFEALDLCRMENRFPNLRLDCAKVANPFEMNCRVMFDREKDDHLGRSAIEELTQGGPARRIIGFVSADDSHEVPQLGDQVTLAGEVIGEVVNAGYSFMLGKSIGLALVSNDLAFVGLDFNVGDRTVTTASAPFVYNKSMDIRPQEHSFHTKG
jgi:glycine cleavage system aminomethyltransferase T